MHDPRSPIRPFILIAFPLWVLAQLTGPPAAQAVTTVLAALGTGCLVAYEVVGLFRDRQVRDR